MPSAPRCARCAAKGRWREQGLTSATTRRPRQHGVHDNTRSTTTLWGRYAMNSIGRRSTFRLLAGSALAGSAFAVVDGSHTARAAEKSVTVGIDLSLTGADAETAV